ncbi:HigA family addiction module antitoxin [Siphonobacter sp. SORGH_AS_1065]|uniref:HigA family addiction module antitoxin n=1 Tax=Siphonobacter sp. SORGH_AS_1065 TaxID=3041795 RepID=UPI00278978F3|nr:HigA family addiction module antitoxin [Siphonobacter sp. SORGH_AS_1065]MDQ1086775.1 addiction module HigA family antidote [Siphonobacter sp. SORGH_AS_1065]
MNKYEILGTNNQPIKLTYVPHPGSILEFELEGREISKSKLAEKLGMYPSQLSAIINEKRNITAAIALKLEKVLEIEAEFWMRCQVDYDLFIERQKLMSQAA